MTDMNLLSWREQKRKRVRWIFTYIVMIYGFSCLGYLGYCVTGAFQQREALDVSIRTYEKKHRDLPKIKLAVKKAKELQEVKKKLIKISRLRHLLMHRT